MPPSVSFEQDSPGQASLMSPSSDLGAIYVVQIPDGKASKEDAQAKGDHGPHLLQDPLVPLVLPLLFSLGLWTGESALSYGFVGLVALAEMWSDVKLHDNHAADQDDGSQNRIGVLVKGRVLEEVVVEGDEQGEAGNGETENDLGRSLSVVGEGGPEHEAGGVDHGQLIDELHGIWRHRSGSSKKTRGGQDGHLRVEWKAKLPEPTMK